ncbi:MAG: hypothetical protein J6A20_08825 [Muribaculaceae bacterium]|nr:hypothetical protein [Muribaculaceae bacterium]
MKRLSTFLQHVFTILIMMTALNVAAGSKKVNNNVTVNSSGRYIEIIDNTNNTCLYVEVSAEKSSTGNIVYELACKNKRTKAITKLALHGAVASLVTSLGTPYMIPVANTIADLAYDDICEYYNDK